jgi:magnesium transporter
MAKSKKRHVFVRRAAPAGTPPGTLSAVPGAAPAKMLVTAYGPGGFVEEKVSDVKSLAGYTQKWPVTWINVDGLGDAATIEAIGELFGLHRLALEDVLNVHQRPKADEFENQIYVVGRMVRVADELETEQVSLFLGRNFVITFQEDLPGDCFEVIRRNIREKIGRIRQLSADYLLYCLVDAIVDNYFPVLEDCGERLESLENEVVSKPTKGTIQRLHASKRRLLELRRIIWPLREALQMMLRDENALIGSDARLHIRDCCDHATQVVELTEIYRELAMSLTDVYLSSVSNRMNEIMKVLTIIATIFMPLSFIVGLYGMNFNPDSSPFNMPELNWRFGYLFVWVMMIATTIGMLIYFRKKGWLSSSESDEPEDEQDRSADQSKNVKEK